MQCPNCGMDTRVVETDKLPETVTRIRWCRNDQCRNLFETRETIMGVVIRHLDAAMQGKPSWNANKKPQTKSG